MCGAISSAFGLGLVVLWIAGLSSGRRYGVGRLVDVLDDFAGPERVRRPSRPTQRRIARVKRAATKVHQVSQGAPAPNNLGQRSVRCWRLLKRWSSINPIASRTAMTTISGGD